jgi:hypothetical protein
MAGPHTKIALWKDADPDIPILKQAKDELRSCSEWDIERPARLVGSISDSKKGFIYPDL